MNKKVILKKLNLFFMILCFLSVSCLNRKSPDIYIDGLSYKFGKVKEGEKIIFTFFFKNTGTKDLIIEDLYISCYCMEIKQFDKIVEPKKRGKIYGVIKTEGFQGKIIKALQVKTNIKNKKPIVLTIEGEILPKKE